MSEVKQYNLTAQLFHWSIAALILGLIVLGFYMDSMERSPFKFELYGYHKALGILVLVMAVMRIIWKHVSERPSPLSHHKNWEKCLSKTIHIVLYLAMIAMPLSGWVMSSAGGYGVSFFGLFDVPAIVDKNKELGRIAYQIHGVLPYIVMGCVGLHILGALKHHVLDQDETLRRMGGNIVFAVLGLFLLAVAAYFPIQNTVAEFQAKNAVHNETFQEPVVEAE